VEGSLEKALQTHLTTHEIEAPKHSGTSSDQHFERWVDAALQQYSGKYILMGAVGSWIFIYVIAHWVLRAIGS
jgi:hypothetical protein